jgi:dCTP diphosphatase
MTNKFEQLLKNIQEFSNERDWSQFHTPKNLVLAITAEVGELSEALQWKSDQEVIEFISTPVGRKKVSEEVADVAIYLIRLCQELDLDFIEILNEKIDVNEIKYPVKSSKGNAKKYTELGF